MEAMYRVLICGVLLALLGAGCDRPALPPATYARHNLANGRYFIDCENTGSGSSLDFSSSSEGGEVKTELYKFEWAKSNQLQIKDGQLSINGADYGAIEPGTRITIQPSGDILLNGSKASPAKPAT